MTDSIPVKEKSIILTGFMGVGKTTAGRLAAKKLGRSFIDIDHVIENDFGMPATDIFRKYGEKKFREKEKETVVSFSKQRRKVISLGGGAFMNEEARKACLLNCVVIYLDMSWEEWKERLELLMDNRPVLQSRSLDEIQKLFNERRKIYAHHHFKITVDQKSAEEAADEIVQSVKSLW